MVGLQRIFKVMDDDNSGSLSVREFSKACKDFKVGISEQNVPILFDLLMTIKMELLTMTNSFTKSEEIFHLQEWMQLRKPLLKWIKMELGVLILML